MAIATSLGFALGFAVAVPLAEAAVAVGFAGVDEAEGADTGDVGCAVAVEFVGGVADGAVVVLVELAAGGAVAVFALSEFAVGAVVVFVDVVETVLLDFAGGGFAAVAVEGKAGFVVVALALSTGSGVVIRGATGSAARYLSQSVFDPPASVYFFRAKVASVSPAGVQRVRFTERAR